MGALCQTTHLQTGCDTSEEARSPSLCWQLLRAGGSATLVGTKTYDNDGTPISKT